MAQPAFPGVEMGMGRKRETRRSRFLDRLSESCPWDAWLALAGEARGADAGARGADPAMGRPRVDDLVLPRMHVVQVCFGLSDRECEDQVWDSATMRSFVGVAPFEVPDATTLCKFRHLLERCGVGEAMVSSALGSAADGGLAAGRGTIAGATLVESPSSTRNADGARDPDAHQAKKGQNWHFGHELGVGADAETGVPHSVRMDAANVHDLDQVPDLVREGDERVWDGAGHVGVGRRPEVAGDPSLSGVEWIVAKRRSQVGEDDLVAEAAKSAARSVVEHVFHWVKDMFGLRKTRYKGLAKVSDQAFAAVAAAGCMIARRGRRLCGPPLALSAEGMAPRRERLEGRRRRAEGGAPAAAWPTAGRPAMVWEAAAWPPKTGVARLGALEPSSRQKSPMLVPKGRDRRLYHRFPHMTRTLSIGKDRLLESSLSTFDGRSAPASRRTATRPTC